MHLKVFVKLNKNPKNPLVWAKKPQKNPLGWFFLKKTRVFSNPDRCTRRAEPNATGSEAKTTYQLFAWVARQQRHMAPCTWLPGMAPSPEKIKRLERKNKKTLFN
jgi:hypothetical protein